jgi:hypothetical protein
MTSHTATQLDGLSGASMERTGNMVPASSTRIPRAATRLDPAPAVLVTGPRDLDEILDALPGWDECGRLVIRANPTRSQHIDDFNGTFRSQANQGQALRPSDFNHALGSYNPLVPLRGDLVSETTTTHGPVVGATIASPEFLGWAQHQHENAASISLLRINPYPGRGVSTRPRRFASPTSSSALQRQCRAGGSVLRSSRSTTGRAEPTS